MDHSKHIRLQPHELTEAILTDAKVYGPDDETIGTISHLHGAGENAQAVVDVGGFLGIGSKPVMVNVHELDVMRDENGNVHAVSHWTKDDLKALPEHHHG